MAKMFYTLDETKSALGRNEEEIKQFTREGKLREFRDGPRLMFKADQVESLKAELGVGGGSAGSGSAIGLAPSDTGLPLSLADSKSGTGVGSGISLADTDSAGGPGMKEDTNLAADLGLSGSVGGVPSPGRTGSGSGSLSGSGRGGSGINVFNPDEVDQADPGAQTAISPSISDQANLEGVGSGSGLLDLTRESDDTSLGAELLDEIGPKGGAAAPAPVGAAAMPAPTGAVSRTLPPAPVREAYDASAPGFAWMAGAAALVCLFGIFMLISGVMDATPQAIRDMAAEKGPVTMGYIVGGAGVALAIVFLVIGLVVGKAAK